MILIGPLNCTAKASTWTKRTTFCIVTGPCVTLRKVHKWCDFSLFCCRIHFGELFPLVGKIVPEKCKFAAVKNFWLNCGANLQQGMWQEALDDANKLTFLNPDWPKVPRFLKDTALIFRSRIYGKVLRYKASEDIKTLNLPCKKAYMWRQTTNNSVRH